MASKSENRRINLFINGKEVKNDIKSIRNEYVKSNSQLNRMTRGSKEYYDQARKVKKLKGMLDQHNKTLGRTRKAWGDFKNQMGAWIATGFGLAAAGRIFSSFLNNIKDFEKAASGLSALTGLMGDELDWLKNKALGMNQELQESGIKMKQTAIDVLEAYKIVGSAKPELLKNKEALADVTKQAIILSEASGMTLQDAVKSLTGDLNQFNESADQSERFINVMAAGAKAGAGDIAYLSEAIEKSGTTMDLMNISYEEGIALVETAAPRFTKAAMAGNSLDKVLLKMKEKGIGYTDGVFDMNTALLELKTRFNNGETAAQIFGVEHSKMAEVLVQSIDDFNNYTEAVTGTNTAIEMASINTNNLQGSLDSLSANWTNFIIGLNEGSGTLGKIFKGFVDMLDEAVMEWRKWTMSDDELAYEAKLKSQQDWMKKFKEHNKGGQIEIEDEWNERLSSQLKAFELFGQHYNDEQLTQYQGELDNINEHLRLIKEAKKQTEEGNIPPSGDGSGGGIGGGGQPKARSDADKLELMQILNQEEIDILDEKLTAMEERESEYASAIAEKHKWTAEQKKDALYMFGDTAMDLTDSLMKFNAAAMNRELKAAGDDQEKKEAIRKAYANKEKAMAIAQATISGALGILRIWETKTPLPSPAAEIYKGIQTGVMVARTAANIALMSSQSYAQGGFTNGAQYYQAGEAGQEYIAPNWQLNNPVTGPIIEGLEQMRLGKSSEIIRETNTEKTFTDPALLTMLQRLEEKLNKPAVANVYLNEDNTDNIQQALDEKQDFLDTVNG